MDIGGCLLRNFFIIAAPIFHRIEGWAYCLTRSYRAFRQLIFCQHTVISAYSFKYNVRFKCSAAYENMSVHELQEGNMFGWNKENGMLATTCLEKCVNACKIRVTTFAQTEREMIGK